jgi:Xaa-Pro aminopeptidase
VRLLEERYPGFHVQDLSPVVDEMRLIKSPRELELVRHATRLSGEAILEAMRSTEPGVAERELDALARFHFTRNGAQAEAYAAIVSVGSNAVYPHHRAAGRVFRDGELVLMDYAPDVGYYRSDVTRIWPVNGRFEGWQRELYGFYLACYQAVLRHIRPGVTAQRVIADAVADIERTLASATFSKPIYRQSAERFVAGYRAAAGSANASLGHWVGMATHDPGPRGGLLRPGMVFTIEPALRVPEESIYIRNEDLIIITETGAEIASDFLPMEMDAIERVIAEPGLLQRFPRSPVFTSTLPPQ